jgi:predicted DNA-binding mobile mystery protein A
MGVSQPRIIELEHAEIADKVTLGTLRRAAEAMNCTLVYAIVPVEASLEETLLDRARKIATKILGDVNHTMVLENQNVSQEEIKNEIEDLAHSLILKKTRILWDEKP